MTDSDPDTSDIPEASEDWFMNAKLRQPPRLLPHEDFHEIWWIFAPERFSYGGRRIAHFRKTIDGTPFFFIDAEPPSRIGPRDWDTVSGREGWIKVEQIIPPGRAKIEAAIDARLREIAKQITKEAGFD